MNKERGYFDGIELKLWFSLWRIGSSLFDGYVYDNRDGFFIRLWVFSLSVYVRWSIADRNSTGAIAWRKTKRDKVKGWNS
jgi:hypothetical protein